MDEKTEYLIEELMRVQNQQALRITELQEYFSTLCNHTDKTIELLNKLADVAEKLTKRVSVLENRRVQTKK